MPAYNGGLFSTDPRVSRAGEILAGLSLGNDRLSPALRDLLLEKTDDGARGAVDFRSLSVREFGTIYEGLLECELAVAEHDLTLDRKGIYRPVKTARDKVVIQRGRVYVHGRGGGRKASGSYYTKDFAVEHLLEHALEPALREHLARLEAIGDPVRTAEEFLHFRVADIAMGSGHFLVAAVDHIERRLMQFLADHPLNGVTQELQRLRAAAQAALGDAAAASEIEDKQLPARSLLDKPEALQGDPHQGEALYIVVVDGPFVDAVTGDGALLLRASARGTASAQCSSGCGEAWTTMRLTPGAGNCTRASLHAKCAAIEKAPALVGWGAVSSELPLKCHGRSPNQPIAP